MSVCDHLMAPGSKGLFRAAIIQSAPCQAQADLAGGQRHSVDYAASVGCHNPASIAACLRALPASALDRPPWYVYIGDSDALSGPVTGTPSLPDGPVTAAAAGQAAQQLVGSVASAAGGRTNTVPAGTGAGGADSPGGLPQN